MSPRIAFDGDGRIGRNVLRALFASQRLQAWPALEIVAIHDLGEARINAHPTRHDTTHGRFGVASRIDCVSTAGGAFLELLEGTTLPAVQALDDRAR